MTIDERRREAIATVVEERFRRAGLTARSSRTFAYLAADALLEALAAEARAAELPEADV